MSWFTEIAGKAENLLNAMDKSAAQVLHSPQTNQNNGNRRHTNTADEQNPSPEDMSESYVY